MRRPQIRSTSSFARRASEYFGMSGPLEFVLAAVLFGMLVVFSVLQVMHQKFDSDEPYDLHIIWGWAHGFVQYRDIFDNHMPLFHIIFVPIFALIGERATILYWMRFLLLPMYFVGGWCTCATLDMAFLISTSRCNPISKATLQRRFLFLRRQCPSLFM